MQKKLAIFWKHLGGEATAIILFLVQICRGLEINPREYQEDVMRRLIGHSAQKLHQLLPDERLKKKQAAQTTFTPFA